MTAVVMQLNCLLKSSDEVRTDKAVVRAQPKHARIIRLSVVGQADQHQQGGIFSARWTAWR